MHFCGIFTLFFQASDKTCTSCSKFEQVRFDFAIVKLRNDAVYLVMKFLFLPTMTTYVPFSAWMQVPPALQNPFRLGIPVVILLVAILAANKVRVRYSSSAVLFYFALALTDAMLTLAVYGVNYMGAL